MDAMEVWKNELLSAEKRVEEARTALANLDASRPRVLQAEGCSPVSGATDRQVGKSAALGFGYGSGMPANPAGHLRQLAAGKNREAGALETLACLIDSAQIMGAPTAQLYTAITALRKG